MKKFETSSIYLAALLMARGIPLLGTWPGGMVTFQFDDSDGKASQLAQEYQTGQATVNASQYVSSLLGARKLIRAVA